MKYIYTYIYRYIYRYTYHSLFYTYIYTYIYTYTSVTKYLKLTTMWEIQKQAMGHELNGYANYREEHVL